jgi:ribosomal protein S18 acetylase RimI-like enzyme
VLNPIPIAERARAVEGNLNAQLPLMYSHMPGVDVYDEPDLLCMVSRLPSRAYNAVYWAGFAPAQAEDRVDAVMERYRQSGRFPVIWVVAPSSQPASLGRILEARGLQVAFRAPGMAADLYSLREDPPPPSLTIERVRNEVQLEQWLQPVASSFEFDPEVTAAYFGLFANRGFGPGLPWQLFVGLERGQPVASSRLFCAAGVAGLYHVATLPGARGRGFGTALTLAATRAARELGYRTAILTASPAGYRLYQRLGFKECVQAAIYAMPGDSP